MTQPLILRTAQVAVTQEEGANDAKAQPTPLLECGETALRCPASDHGLGIHGRRHSPPSFCCRASFCRPERGSHRSTKRNIVTKGEELWHDSREAAPAF